jgi:hypothetical protein
MIWQARESGGEVTRSMSFKHSMSKTVARIAESGVAWELFRTSEWFRHSAIEQKTIRESLALLDREIKRLQQGHPDSHRKRKALERLISVLNNTPKSYGSST